MRVIIGGLIGISLIGWLGWQKHQQRRVNQPMLLILIAVITLSWTLAETKVTYAGVPVTRTQLIQIKQLTAAEKELQQVLTGKSQVTAAKSQLVTVRTTLKQLDGEMNQTSLQALTGQLGQLKHKSSRQWLFNVNAKLAQRLGKTTKQRQAVQKQLKVDVGL
ncbi:hypothetical protein [Lactobacillus plantarum subsp. plantarum ST-III] [Lactiplantibacillus mudanjiangensis]|uniref:hypothetical protein n=1 Tax=Lactiplantibacillus mudanjiangensis TaxID=1296538 RepID=UPI001015BC4D|nr:hypothetical protein [Lactiplantibacillus mudanjiangensis]VDG17509.1 hypothetical protein [Lactobacillus plantarum subsp. plantarum ST-III] [Lactiplantibacillus mudanjiangensis]VDG32811.1 hypothetical protein [Lactobacillus plantarum subsp. plantarum ST-III] [Lactiplantibacillus mudanjiangensis]